MDIVKPKWRSPPLEEAKGRKLHGKRIRAPEDGEPSDAFAFFIEMGAFAGSFLR